MTTVTVSPTATVRRRAGRAVGLPVALAAVILLSMLSIALGSRDVSPLDVVRVLFDPSVSADGAVIREMRLPRTMLAIAVGAALALAGTLLQGVARNPLADSGVLGINAGAATAVVAVTLAVGTIPVSGSVWFAFAGAGIATVAVYSIASAGREGATPVKLALAGAAMAALGTSITSAIVLRNADALNTLRMWEVGALAGRYFPVLTGLAPYFVLGIVAALFTGRALNLLALGDDLARSLGLRVVPVRAVVFTLVAILAGAATAACGPIVFVGLIVPHVARLICGPDYRWILVWSALLGPVLVLGADIIGRIILPAGEVPVGVVIGIVGAPVFIALVRMRRVIEL